MTKTAALPARKPATTRERFVSMTARLMSRRGYAGVGLNEIVEKSGAPKGSLYHFFPGGKEQLAAAAVDWAAECFLATLDEAIAKSGSAAAAVGALAAQIAVWMEESGCKDGSPLTIVAVETGAFSEPLRLACQRGYQAWADALAEAGLSVWDLSFAESHDCFTIAELIEYEAMGLTAPGEGKRAIMEGWTQADGKLPVNPSGGLKSKGHPIGATGVSMHVMAAMQLSGTAGDIQVKNAKLGGVFNMGGVAVANYVSILEPLR